MGNTLYTLFLFGCPFLICVILWHAIKAVIKHFWPKKSETESSGCLNIAILLALGVLFFIMLIFIDSNFATTVTVERNKDCKIEHHIGHNFSWYGNADEESRNRNKLVNNSDITVYVYSEYYSTKHTFFRKPTYTVVCTPGRTIPLNMDIDYYFEPAPENIQVESETASLVRWVLDSVVPYAYIIPVAPDSPVITHGKIKSEEVK